MTMTPPPLPGKERSTFVTVAIGCGVVALVVVLILVGGVIWLFQPGGERIEMGAVVGTNAVAMAHLTDCSEDPGVVALSERVMAIARDVQRRQLAQELPESLRGLSDLVTMFHGNWDPSYLPEVVLAAESLEPSNEVVVVAVALDALPKVFTLPFRMGMRHARTSGGMVSYRDQAIADGGDGVVTFMDTTLLFASDIDVMRGAVDRILDGAPPTTLLELPPLSYPDQWDLYGIVRNQGNVLSNLVAELDLPEVPTELIEDAWFGVDVASAEQVRAELTVRCTDEAAAQRVLDWVRSLIEQASAELDDQLIDIALTGECEGTKATLSIDIVGVSRLIEQKLQSAMTPPATQEKAVAP